MDVGGHLRTNRPSLPRSEQRRAPCRSLPFAALPSPVAQPSSALIVRSVFRNPLPPDVRGRHGGCTTIFSIKSMSSSFVFSGEAFMADNGVKDWQRPPRPTKKPRAARAIRHPGKLVNCSRGPGPRDTRPSSPTRSTRSHQGRPVHGDRRELEKHAKQELEHALTISKQIDYLGGMPTVQAQAGPHVGRRLRTCCASTSRRRNETIRNYPSALRQCEAWPSTRSPTDSGRFLVNEQEAPDRPGYRPRRGRARRRHGGRNGVISGN